MEKLIKPKILEKILLIDDDDIYNQIFAYSLLVIDPEIQLHVEKGVDKAINYLLKNNAPDLILIDVNMPLKNGYEFLKLYEEHFSITQNSPLIYMMTSSILMDDKIKAANYSVVTGFKIKGDVMAILKEIIAEGFS